MKRYLLFGYDRYYPTGGSGDFIASFKSIEAIRQHIRNQKWAYDYYDVLDRIEGEWLDYDKYNTDIYD